MIIFIQTIVGLAVVLIGSAASVDWWIEKNQLPSKKVKRLLSEINEIENEQNAEKSIKHIYSISKKIKRQTDKELIYEYLCEKKAQDEKSLVQLLDQTKLLEPHLSLKTKRLFDKLFAIRCIGKFELTMYRKEVLELLHENQSYIDANVIKTLSSLGDATCLIKGIDQVKLNGSLLSDTFLVDCMVAFKEKEHTLNDRILKAFDKAPETVKQLYIKYFSEIGYEYAASHIYEELIKELEKVKEEQSDPIKETALIYFSKVKYDPVKTLLIQLFNEKTEMECILAAKALVLYPDREVAWLLKQGIEDERYQIREQSAKSFYEMLCKDETLFDVVAHEEDYVKKLVNEIVYEEELLRAYWNEANLNEKEEVC